VKKLKSEMKHFQVSRDGIFREPAFAADAILQFSYGDESKKKVPYSNLVALLKQPHSLHPV
jgi:hypothetical protein